MEHFLFEDKLSNNMTSVYNRLQDEQSKKIFRDRCLYSLTNDKSFLKDIIHDMDVSCYLISELKKHHDKKKIMFGMGEWARAILRYFPEIDWFGYVDNSKDNIVQDGGLKRININELVSQYKEECIVISVMYGWKDIEQQLLTAGFQDGNIITPMKEYIKRQYFDVKKANYDDYIFIDGGGYDGDTSLQFIEWSGNNFKSIFLFEPDAELMHICKKNLSNVKDCTFIQKGLWRDSANLKFVKDGVAAGLIEDKDGEVVSVSLDSCFHSLDSDAHVFLKMDIEGSELEALEGSRKLIQKCHPQMAVSVYHKRRDIWEIPSKILEIDKTYIFYLRTYSFTGNDTVLYAF